MNQMPNGDFSALWRDFFRPGTDLWPQAAPPPSPSLDPAQFWQPLLSMWVPFWLQTFAQLQSPDMRSAAHKSWSEQLNMMAQAFEGIMQTEAYSTLQSKFLEQCMTWQKHMTGMGYPQTASDFSTPNPFSSHQSDRGYERVSAMEDRVYERVSAMEDRFNDLEDTMNQILSKLQEQPVDATTDRDAA